MFARRCSLRLRLRWRHQFKATHPCEKGAPIHDMVELERGRAAAEMRDEFFKGITRVLRRDTNRSQVSGISEPGEKFAERVASLEGQSAGTMRPADQILNQEQFVK